MAVTLLGFYAAFAYDLERYDFIRLISLYVGAFFLSFKLIQSFKVNVKILLILGIAARLVFLIALPNLSQDYFRFLWDGRLLAEGLNPYLNTPNQWVALGEIPIAQAQDLLNGMGALSRQHYSNYPPANQFFFWLSGILSGNSIIGGVIVLRICCIAADLGIFWIGRKLLKKLKLPEHQIFWYFLNPFIIIELTGNLHFEGVMLFFLLASLYLLFRGNWFWSALLMGLSIAVKLLPLLMLPLFFQYLITAHSKTEENLKPFKLLAEKPLQSLWKLFRYYVVVIGVFILSFTPFFTEELVAHFSQTIGLWFQKFEFNAGVYYIIRWIGFQVKGYNIIATAGKLLPIVVIAGLMLLTLFRKSDRKQHLMSTLLLGTSLYFLCATTVHPWYIATPLLLSIFTRFRFAIIWSLVVFLSYSAYKIDRVEENFWLVAVEYLVVLGFFIWELWVSKRTVVLEFND